MRLEDYSFPISENDISIHAPLTGCDLSNIVGQYMADLISIHAPLTGCDDIKSLNLELTALFQSTHPLRDATG